MTGGAKKKVSSKRPPAGRDASFEATLERLAQIVGQLEHGDLPLEKSIELFEEGMGLTKASMAMLDEAERKVERLLQDDGEEKRAPFDVDRGGES